MTIRFCKMLAAGVGISAAIFLPTFELTNDRDSIVWRYSAALAQTSEKISEKDAFESAKELGTLDAWEAFLIRFPKGFYGDLARAYVRKSGATPNTTTRPAKPSIAENPPKKQYAQKLPYYAVGPGSTHWHLEQQTLGRGISKQAAAVRVGGVTMLVYCNTQQRISALVRETPGGDYPQFQQRLSQGLAAASARAGVPNSPPIQVRLSNGRSYTVSGNAQQTPGSLTLSDDRSTVGFNAFGNLVNDLMSEQTVTVSLPPFAATFQLTKSRKSICSVIRSCGLSVPGCSGIAAQSVSQPRQGVAQPSSSGSPRCSGGRYYSKSKGRCACRKGRSWNGNGCERLRCGKNFKLRRGKCVRQQNCGSHAYRSVEGDCYCKKNYEKRGGKCKWKVDKKTGFEIAPWKSSSCKSLKRKCKKGNVKFCIKYDEDCNIN